VTAPAEKAKRKDVRGDHDCKYRRRFLRLAFTTSGTGTWFKAPRGSHSEKPALFADLIEKMSPGPYVELFARQPRLGWDSWGYGYEQAAS